MRPKRVSGCDDVIVLQETQRELQLCSIFEQKDLKISGDIAAVYISGICLLNEDSILLADYWNRKVKLLKTSTKKVIVAFEETSNDWGVSNVLAFAFSDRAFLVITEWCHADAMNDRIVISCVSPPKPAIQRLELNEHAKV